jgi:hypothetical protein
MESAQKPQFPIKDGAGGSYSMIELLSLSMAYIISAANDYWLINWFESLGVDLIIFFAIMQNTSWPLQLYLYQRELRSLDEPRRLTGAMLRSYLLLGLLASIVSVSKTIGIATLPAVLSVICANSEIVFQTVLSRTVLAKPVSLLQLCAVILILMGVIVSIYTPGKGFSNDDYTSNNSSFTLVAGIAWTLLSRFLSSLNSVLAEKYLGLDVKSKIGAKECAIATTLGPFVFLPLVLFFDNEYLFWREELWPTLTWQRWAVVTLCIALSLSKLVDRFSKFGIIAASSTIFFAGIDSVMKCVAGVGAFFFFNDTMDWPTILAFILVMIAIGVLYVDQKSKMESGAQDTEGRYKEIRDDGDMVGMLYEGDGQDEAHTLLSNEDSSKIGRMAFSKFEASVL